MREKSDEKGHDKWKWSSSTSYEEPSIKREKNHDKNIEEQE